MNTKNLLLAGIGILMLSTVVKATPEPNELSKMKGTYLTSIISNIELLLTVEDGKLYVSSKGQGKFALNPLSKNQFSLDGTPFGITFVEDSEGNFDTFILDQGNKKKTYTKKAILKTAYEKVAKKVRPNGLSDSILLNDIESAKALIEAGIDVSELDTRPNIAGKSGRRPLNWAALENNTEMISLLLKAGADINHVNLSGFTPLHHAAEANSIEAAELLIKRGALIHLKTKNKKTALQIAAINNHAKLVSILQKHAK